MARLIRDARERAGSAMLITGEAGIGKTALIAAAGQLAARAGMAVRSARAGELESEFAWGVVRQLFTGPAIGAGSGDDMFAGAAALARPALGIEPAATAADASYATLHGLYWLTVNLAQRSPLLLSVDDLHWADLPSLRFIAHLLPRVAELPVLLVLAGRPAAVSTGPGSALLTRIGLEPTLTVAHPAALRAPASATVVRTELSTEATDDFCLACHEVSGGNPFLLRSLVADLAAEQVPTVGSSVARVRRLTPAAVSASVLLRLAQLPKAALDLARAVAILGAPSELRPARLLAGLEVDEAAAAAGGLIRAGIFSGDRLLGFVHPLVRSAVYGDLSGPERGRWHYRAARLLADEQAPLERVALQLRESLPDADAWTVGRLREAAADARARGAPEIAGDFLRRALAEPPSDELRARLLFELGTVEALHDPTAALPHLSEALEHASDGSTRAVIALTLGDAFTLAGRLADAVRVLGDELGAAEHEPAAVRASLASAQLSAARWEPSAQHLRRELVADLRRRVAAGELLGPRLHGELAIGDGRGRDRPGRRNAPRSNGAGGS